MFGITGPGVVLHKELLYAETILGDWFYTEGGVRPPLIFEFDLRIFRRGAKGGIVTCASKGEVVSETEQKLGLDP